jgi:hypothetical protein
MVQYGNFNFRTPRVELVELWSQFSNTMEMKLKFLTEVYPLSDTCLTRLRETLHAAREFAWEFVRHAAMIDEVAPEFRLRKALSLALPGHGIQH